MSVVEKCSERLTRKSRGAYDLLDAFQRWWIALKCSYVAKQRDLIVVINPIVLHANKLCDRYWWPAQKQIACLCVNRDKILD